MLIDRLCEEVDEPPKPRQPVKLGWFIPSDSGLNRAVRMAIKDGRRVVVDPIVTGPLWFVAEDR